MSATVPDTVVSEFNERYRSGPDRYVNWVEDKLPVEVAESQKRILRAVAEHRRVIVIGANGPGKTYAAVVLTEAFLNTNRPSTVLATSGTYGKLKRTLCRPLKSLHSHDDLAHELPGTYKHSPPRIDTGDSEWYFEAARPKDAEELEGTHNHHLLAITEEADKPAVDHDVIESMDSCLTDENDRHLVIANPPRDRTNVVYELMESDKWHTVRVSTWDSRNVRVDIGEHPGPKIPGLLGLSEVRDKWEEWNGEPWPGIEQAQVAHQERTDLDERWYRRRAGVMPPDDAAKHRPFYADDVGAALERGRKHERAVDAPAEDPIAVGVDLARKGGDETVVSIFYPSIVTRHVWSHTDHGENEQQIKDIIDALGTVPPGAVDATGEGSGVADALRDAYGFYRFKVSENAVKGDEYDNKWTEALHCLGRQLDTIGLPNERKSREEYYTAARAIEYEERGLKSGDVLRATPKVDLKERLGYSPDRLDADAMAAWAATYLRRRKRDGPTRGDTSGVDVLT